STNPCGEQPLLPYESCNLGSINLSKFVRGSEIDYERLERVIKIAIHFLDNVIDVNQFPVREMEEITMGNRKIGLGVMGFSDMLIKLKIPYNSDKVIKVAKEIMKFISEKSKKASQSLAMERGVFPNFKGSVYDSGKGFKIRNAALTTIAPTGSLSIIANCSGGIEPLFAICYNRQNILDDEKLVEVNPLFEKVARERGFYSKKLMKKIAERGSVMGLREVPKDVQKIFVTAHDISPEWHVKMQAAFQKYIDNAVSKTVNFPHDATKEDVEKVFMLAFELGCKGVTIYRDGSREKQVLNIGERKKSPRPRPEVTTGGTVKITTGCGSLYVTINEDEKGLCEVFTHIGKSGGCLSSQSEVLGRLISLSLRAGVSIDSIIKQLRGIRCLQPHWTKDGVVLSCPDAMGIAIQRYISDEKNSVQLSLNSSSDLNGWCPECPECGGILEIGEGCATCRSCGYTKCG
ncbi:MAG: adenosylcobalamin-dependent ribonucleoside-diphosphate reductase, partial [Candidatus Methanofastidiosia archaeon]